MHLFGTVDDNTFFYDLMKVRELEKFEETKIYLQFGVGLEKYTFTFYKRILGVYYMECITINIKRVMVIMPVYSSK